MIRIGETHRCRDEHEQGIAVLREAAALARVEAPELEDFALQHLGKCLVDAGRTRRAWSNWSVRLRFGSERPTRR